jgi:hypothetical protein
VLQPCELPAVLSAAAGDPTEGKRCRGAAYCLTADANSRDMIATIPTIERVHFLAWHGVCIHNQHPAPIGSREEVRPVRQPASVPHNRQRASFAPGIVARLSAVPLARSSSLPPTAYFRVKILLF